MNTKKGRARAPAADERLGELGIDQASSPRPREDEGSSFFEASGKAEAEAGTEGRRRRAYSVLSTAPCLIR